MNNCYIHSTILPEEERDPVASPGFVDRRGKLGNGALTADFRAGCSSCSMNKFCD